MTLILVALGFFLNLGLGPQGSHLAGRQCWGVELAAPLSETEAMELADQLAMRVSGIASPVDAWPDGDQKIIVAVDGMSPEAIRNLLAPRGRLDFVPVIAEGGGEIPSEFADQAISHAMPDSWIVLDTLPEIPVGLIEGAFATFDQNGAPAVRLQLTPEGAQIMSDLTTAALTARTDRYGDGRKQANPPYGAVAIVIDGKVISAPRVIEPITQGEMLMTGSYTIQDVQNLAALLAAGPLKAQVEAITGPVPCATD